MPLGRSGPGRRELRVSVVATAVLVLVELFVRLCVAAPAPYLPVPSHWVLLSLAPLAIALLAGALCRFRTGLLLSVIWSLAEALALALDWRAGRAHPDLGGFTLAAMAPLWGIFVLRFAAMFGVGNLLARLYRVLLRLSAVARGQRPRDPRAPSPGEPLR